MGLSRVRMGEAFIFDTLDADLDERDSYSGDEQNMDDEAQRMMVLWDRGELLREVEEEKENSNTRDQDDTSFYDGEISFEELKNEMQPLEGDFVWIKMVEENTKGKEITARNTVLFDCVGFLEYNPEPFDSSIHSGRPKLCNLAEDDGVLIPGILMGLLQLRQGERAHLLIHPALAFKSSGAYPLVPPDAYLYYCIKVHKVWDEGDFDGFLQYEKRAHVLIPLEEKLMLSKEHKDVANKYLRDDEPREALVRYKAAIMWLSETPQEELDTSPDCVRLLSLLWQNVAITQNRLEMYKSASKSARQAYMLDPNNVKALYQLAKARLALSDQTRALNVLRKAESIAPKNPAILHLKSQIDLSLRDEKKKRLEIELNMARGLF